MSYRVGEWDTDKNRPGVGTLFSRRVSGSGKSRSSTSSSSSYSCPSSSETSSSEDESASEEDAASSSSLLGHYCTTCFGKQEPYLPYS